MINDRGYHAAHLLVLLALGSSALNSSSHAVEAASAATIEVNYNEGLLTGVVRNAPLVDALQMIAKQANFSLVVRGNLSKLVTYSFENIATDEAIRLLLGNTSRLMTFQHPRARDGAQVPVMLVVNASSDRSTSSPPLHEDMRSRLKHPDVVVRVSAVRQLATERLAGDFELLVQALRTEEDPGLRQVAAAALTGFHDKPAAAALMSVLTDGDPSPTVRKQAARSLGTLHSDKAARLSDWGARRALAKAARSDPDETVRRAASAVLTKW